MATKKGTNERKEEIDADRVIRNYEESEQALSPTDENQADVEWYEQGKQDPLELQEAVVSEGDIDGDWKKATAGGGEVVGGSNPTPDQNLVDEVGKAMGVTYADAEPLRLEEKIAQRDEERWELNPVSSEDYAERQTSEEGP